MDSAEEVAEGRKEDVSELEQAVLDTPQIDKNEQISQPEPDEMDVEDSSTTASTEESLSQVINHEIVPDELSSADKENDKMDTDKLDEDETTPEVSEPDVKETNSVAVTLETKPDSAGSQILNGHSPSEIMTRKRAASLTNPGGPRAKLIRNVMPLPSNNPPADVLEDDGEHDWYCWSCHRPGVEIRCRICPRSYHIRCIQHDSPDSNKAEDGTCVCPECIVVMKAENVNHRSDAMQLLNMDQLSSLLKHICGRMKQTPGSEPFLKPVSQEDAEDYSEYVKFPMDIAKLETNIANRQYGSTEAFLADVQWIVHNSIVFNSVSSPYTAAARRLLKVCRQELSEIETCPECYRNAHDKSDWFTEVCKRPHILVWAKLKGFPYWPAKAMKVKDDLMDVRFFGEHDRAWVRVKDCLLYTEAHPYASPKKSALFSAAVGELNRHVEKLRELYGEVILAEGKVTVEPVLGTEQIQRLLPTFTPEESGKLQGSAQLTTQTGIAKPVVLTISSIKTSPTVVSNSALVANAPSIETDSSGTDEEELVIAEESNPDAEIASSASETESSDIPVKGEPAIEVDQPEKSDATIKEDKIEAVKEEDAVEDSKSEETDEKSKPGEPKQRQRVPSGILASALGLRRITKNDERKSTDSTGTTQQTPTPPTRKSLRRLSVASNNSETKSVKGNEDSTDMLKTTAKSEIQQQKKLSKAQDLMDQISSQAQTKPGYRFNISKDISISAIGTTDVESSVPKVNGKLRKSDESGTETGTVKPLRSHQRPTAVGKTPSMQSQIQQMTQGKLTPSQRLAQITSQKNSQQNLKSIRPNPPKSAASSVSANIRPSLGKTESPPASSVATTLQMTTAQSISGAITLPGGTITVTPLTPIITSIPVATPAAIPSYGSPSSVNLNGAVNGLPALVPSKSGQLQSTSVVRRTGTVTLPSTVMQHMQQCSKGITDLLKSTVEQIAFDILDGGTSSGKIDATVAQKEKETLVVKHAKEIADLRHSHEIAMRELRATLENDKRRQIIDTKRLCEQEKTAAVEEAKKKQWCARCQREAQFYCCWNTSYCGYHCQEQHWPQHMNICNQKGQSVEDSHAQQND